MSAHVLSELDALVDLAVTLQKLKHRLMPSLAQSARVLLEELVELFLLLDYILLRTLDLNRVLKGLGCCLHLIDLV